MRSDQKELFRVYVDKYGSMDFGVNGSLTKLDRHDMSEFRQMLVVAIGTAEDMWRREQNNKPENQANAI